MDAAHELASARVEMRLSRRALARRSGVSDTTIARIERGQMEPTVSIMARLLAGCGKALTVAEGPGVPGPTPPGFKTAAESLDLHRGEVRTILAEFDEGFLAMLPDDEPDTLYLLVESSGDFPLATRMSLIYRLRPLLGCYIEVLLRPRPGPQLDELLELAQPV